VPTPHSLLPKLWHSRSPPQPRLRVASLALPIAGLSHHSLSFAARLPKAAYACRLDAIERLGWPPTQRAQVGAFTRYRFAAPKLVPISVPPQRCVSHNTVSHGPGTLPTLSNQSPRPQACFTMPIIIRIVLRHSRTLHCSERVHGATPTHRSPLPTVT